MTSSSPTAPNGRNAGLLALVGMGVEPGLSDIFARYAADELFSSVDEIGVRDGANLVVEGYDFCPTFSIWTTIEECLNPPVIWERGRGWFTTEPFSEPETFNFPAGIGPVECVNVEHEEVLLVPRWIDTGRVTFKYGLGDEFIGVLKVLHMLGLDATSEVTVGASRVAPRDVVAACLPDPAGIGERMHGLTCAGTWVTGSGKDGAPREVYLHHVVDNDWSMAEYGSQAVVWQTAINPVLALELVAAGGWSGEGLRGPEAMPPVPFLDLLSSSGAPWALQERAPTPSHAGSELATPGRRHWGARRVRGRRPPPRPSYVSRTWARLAWISRWVRCSALSSSPNPAFTLLRSGFQSSSRWRPSCCMIRSPCFSANIKEMVSISPKRSRSGARVAMAPSRKTRFFTNNMSSLGMRAPSASSDLIDRWSSPTNSSAVSVVGSIGGRSRPSWAITASISVSAGSAPRSRSAATCDGMSRWTRRR